MTDSAALLKRCGLAQWRGEQQKQNIVHYVIPSVQRAPTPHPRQRAFSLSLSSCATDFTTDSLKQSPRPISRLDILAFGAP